MSSTNQPIRSGPDDYQTPKWCIEALLPQLHLQGSLLEPCQGDGNLISVLSPFFDRVDWCEIQGGRDFFTWEGLRTSYDWVITNPPFNQALPFLQKSLLLAPNVAFLLRLNFLGSQKRKEFWQNHPPTALFVLSRRPSFVGGGTDSTEYAWFVWSKKAAPHGIIIL